MTEKFSARYYICIPVLLVILDTEQQTGVVSRQRKVESGQKEFGIKPQNSIQVVRCNNKYVVDHSGELHEAVLSKCQEKNNRNSHFSIEILKNVRINSVCPFGVGLDLLGD